MNIKSNHPLMIMLSENVINQVQTFQQLLFSSDIYNYVELLPCVSVARLMFSSLGLIPN